MRSLTTKNALLEHQITRHQVFQELRNSIYNASSMHIKLWKWFELELQIANCLSVENFDRLKEQDRLCILSQVQSYISPANLAVRSESDYLLPLTYCLENGWRAARPYWMDPTLAGLIGYSYHGVSARCSILRGETFEHRTYYLSKTPQRLRSHTS